MNFGIIWVMCLGYFSDIVFATSLLMIGDSLDRGVGQGWCEFHNLTSRMVASDWGNVSIRYGGNWGVLHSPSRCDNLDTNDSISTLHIYGASESGPYSPNYWQKTPDTINETKRRVAIGVTQYIELYGKPDKLSFQSNPWENQYMRESFPHLGEDDRKKFLEGYEFDINQRFDQLNSLLQNDSRVELMSRSSPLGAMDYQITIEHNDILRKVTKERNISFYDYSGDIWATLGGYDPNKVVMIVEGHGDNHPSHTLSAVAGAKMLSKRYSQQLVQHDSSYKLKTMKGVEIKFMVAHDAQHGNMQYYFTDYVNGTRHKWHVFAHSAAESRKNKRQLVEVLSAEQQKDQEAEFNSILMSFYCSPSDVFYITHDIAQKIPTAGHLPPIFNTTHRIGFTTKLNNTHGDIQTNMYISFPGFNFIKPIKDESYFKLFGVANIVHDVEPRFLTHLWRTDAMPPHLYFQDILLRFHTSKQVFLVEIDKITGEATKHGFNGLAAFIRKGFDFDQVIVITTFWWMEVLPTGSVVE